MNNSAYEARVRQLESEGMTRSDAQGVVDVEVMRGKAVKYRVIRVNTGRPLRDAITREIIDYKTLEDAERAAVSSNVYARVDGRRDWYRVEPA